MIDVFLNTNTPLKDIPSALSGFDSRCVQVRNGGSTEVWERGASGWARRQPGLTLFDQLCHDHMELVAYTVAFGGGFSDCVSDGMALLLSEGEAAALLTHMERYQYQLEDAIGCSINVKGRSCALACFSLSEFKKMVDREASWGPKVIAWVKQVQAAGADEVGLVIAHAREQKDY